VPVAQCADYLFLESTVSAVFVQRSVQMAAGIIMLGTGGVVSAARVDLGGCMSAL